MSRVLITGGAGFVGHHFIEHFIRNSDHEIVILDKLNYSCNGTARLDELKIAYESEWDKRVTLMTWDLTKPMSHGMVKKLKNVNYIFHLAAETHVDNSIVDPMLFVQANIVATCNLLEFARLCDDLHAFSLFSTDEVFGPAASLDSDVIVDDFKLVQKHTYKEWDRYNATNPYSATKASAEQLTLAYMNTYEIPGFITRCMNIFGERQHPEKFIPLVMRKVLSRECVYIHGSKDCQTAGSRFYIHARNVANGISTIMNKFNQRDFYNIVGEREVDNLTLARMIADVIGIQLRYEIVDFHSSRPGHDLRYALNGQKMYTEYGWKPPVGFQQSLEKMVKWTLAHRPEWL